MFFFGKATATDDKNPAHGPITSVIGKDMILKGDISFQGKLRLDGRVDGNAKGVHLILGTSGHIAGDVEAEVLVCHGTVNGDIKVRKLFATNGCVINGKIQTNDLAVESGASLCGEVKASTKDLRLIQKNEHPEVMQSGDVR